MAERFYRIKRIYLNDKKYNNPMMCNNERYISDRHGNTFLRPSGVTNKVNGEVDTEFIKTVIEVIEPAVVKTYTQEEWMNRNKKETPQHG